MMQMLCVECVRVGKASGRTDFMMRGKIRNSFARVIHRISWCIFESVAYIQIQTVKLSNHQCVEDGMRWRIVWRLEANHSQVHI